MSKSLPRWLFLLIGLVILVVVSAVVFRSINAMNTVAVKKALRSYSTTTSSGSYSIRTMSDKHVFLIMMENHNWSDIKNNASASYINNTLLPTASYAEQYYNPPGNHPSEPNYLWLEAGTNFGISNDFDPVFNHQSTTQHFVTLLSNAGFSWKSYRKTLVALIARSPEVGHTPPSIIRWFSSMMLRIPMIRIRLTAFLIYGRILNWLQIYSRILNQTTASLRRICVMICTTPARLSMIL